MAEKERIINDRSIEVDKSRYAEKKAYKSPKLMKYGKIEEITKGNPLLGQDLLVLGS